MKKLPKKIKLAAIAASISIIFATPAYSGVIATAILDISNLKFTNAVTGGNLNNIRDITILSGNNFGNLGADIFSVPGSTSSTQSENIIPSGGSFNGAQVMEGAGGFPRVEDNYSFRTVPPGQTGKYAYADNRLNGSSIDLDTNNDGAIDAFAGVTASTIAEVMLNATDTGNATSTTGTNFAFNFTANADLSVNLGFDFNIQTLAFVDPLTSIPPSSATAGVSWNISLVDQFGNTQSFAPTSLQSTSSRNDFFTGLDDKNTAGGSESLLFNLVAGRNYQVGISHQVQANATKTMAVPEPGSLALLGLGLAAFAFRRQGKIIS